MSNSLLFTKTIAFFFEPLGIVVTLLVFGLLFLYRGSYKKAKGFISLALITLFFLSYPPFVNFLVKNLENKYPKFVFSQEVKYIHVLGNGHNSDKSQPISSHLNATQTKRVLEGIIIQKQMQNAKLIFTGYAGSSDTPNAQMSAALALALGVDKETIIINNKPETTREEARFLKKLAGEEPFVLVSSASHMPRAMMLFRSLGMHPIAAPTNYYKDTFQGYLRKPTARTFFMATVALHEYFGIVWAKLRAIF